MASYAAEPQVITETPEGDLYEVYASSAYTYLLSQGGLGYFAGNDGYSSKIVTNGTDMYVHNIISEYPGMNSWIKGTINEDNTVEFDFPQPVAVDNGNVLYVNMMELETSGGTSSFVPSAGNNTLVMKWDGKTLSQVVSANPASEERYNGLIGLTNANGDFRSYGETNVSYTVWTTKPAEAPEGLATEDYAFTYVDEWKDAGKTLLQIGVADGKIWIKGISADLPQAWVTGDIDANGKVTLPSGQFLGVANNYYYFFYGASNEGVVTGEVYSWLDNAVLLKLGEGWITNDSFMINLGCTHPWFGKGMSNIMIEKTVDSEPIPANPEWGDPEWDENDGMGVGDFYIPAEDIDGQPLNTENLYYRLFYNGEPVDFGSGENNNEFKYGEESDFILYMYDWYFVIFFEPLQSIGVQSVYKINGQEYCSEIVTFTFEDAGVVNVGTDSSNVVRTEYFNLSGIRVDNPSGLCIRRAIKADGSVESAKIYVK